jgi:uncharacterized protein involved in type VI secretion and phage assembly
MRISNAAAFLVLASGCAAAPPETGTTSPSNEAPGSAVDGEGGCDAAAAQGVVGRQRSEAAGAEALRLSGAATLRWIEPGMMVTMDYRPDRLNIELDEAGKITRLRCG